LKEVVLPEIIFNKVVFPAPEDHIIAAISPPLKIPETRLSFTNWIIDRFRICCLDLNWYFIKNILKAMSIEF
jgi:hypothetical protein